MDTVRVEEQKAILLVEDDEYQVVLAMRALRNHGIVSEVDEVVVAGDGGEALDYLFGEGGYAGRDTRLTPEFVLLDVDLPGMNGLEVLEKLRSDERTELLPVILFSATNRHGDVVEGYKLGANSYVAKPTSFSEFSEAMRLLGWYTGLTGTNHRSKTQEAEQLFATSRASGTPRTLPRAYS